MPRITNALIDERFAGVREPLIAVVRSHLADQLDALQAVGTWLDEEFSEDSVKELLDRRFKEYLNRDLGQMTRPESGLGSMTLSHRSEIAGDHLRADRLEFAISSLHTENHRKDGLSLLGSNIPRVERHRNALRVVVVSACIIDPDAHEYLAQVTPIAEVPWRGDCDAVPQIRGRSELLHRWGWIAIDLLAEALEALRWITRPERSTASVVDETPLEREELHKAVKAAQDR